MLSTRRARKQKKEEGGGEGRGGEGVMTPPKPFPYKHLKYPLIHNYTLPN
jgi:hypothetical protein